MPEHIAGAGFFARIGAEPTPKGGRLEYHAHNFPHLFMALAGQWLVTMNGREVVVSAGIRGQNRIVVPAGAVHSATALADDSEYECWFAHRMPQAVRVDTPGARVFPPLLKRDSEGVLWCRVDETVVHAPVDWQEAYL